VDTRTFASLDLNLGESGEANGLSAEHDIDIDGVGGGVEVFFEIFR
jgi:hypothetical protein